MRAAVYCRISADPEGRELGVERQEQDCRALAARLGWEVVLVEVDNDVSASTRSRKTRPAYDRLLAAVEARLVDVVIVYSTSRLTRRPLEYERWIELVESHGLKIETVVSGTVNLATADGRFVARMLAAADAAEAERISERVSRAVRQRAEAGAWHGARPPFGYTFEPGIGLVPNPEQAEVVRLALARFLDGESIYAISRSLPVPFQSRSLSRFLRNPTIAGLRVVDGTPREGQWEAIVDREDWERAQAIFADDVRFRMRSAPHVTSRRYVLSGLLHCGHPDCARHATLIARTGSDGLHWACQPPSGCGRIRTLNAPIEELISALAIARLQTRDFVQRQHRADVTDDREAFLRVQQTEQRMRLERLEDSMVAGEISRSGYLRNRDRLRAESDQVDAEIASLVSTGERMKLPVGGEARRRWEEGDAAYRRGVLHTLIEAVEVKPFPAGRSTRPSPDPKVREALLLERLDVRWRL